MADEVEVDEDLPSQPEKRTRGRPRKASKLDDISFSQIETIFASLEKKLLGILSEHVAEALAPLRALLKEQLKVMNDCLAELDSKFRDQLQQLNTDLSKMREQIRQMAKPTYAETSDSALCRTSTQPPSLPSEFTHAPVTHVLPRPDRSLNLVFYGIPESKKGTPKHIRSSDDLSFVTDILSKADTKIDNFSIRICHRLGKYKEHAPSPRPILVTFNRASDVSHILHKRSSLPSNFVIKPDMTPEQRAREALLLKQRWLLIQSGTPKKDIRIRGSKLYLNNRVHGQIVNSEYCLSPLLGDVAPVINNLAGASIDGDNSLNPSSDSNK